MTPDRARAILEARKSTAEHRKHMTVEEQDSGDRALLAKRGNL
jgi:hypothetical protein